MHLPHVRSFVAVVEEGGFRRAAAALHLTQPAVTHHVDRLEASLGVRLLDRGPGGSVLTDAGARFLEHGRALLELEEAARRAARADRYVGTCRIGVVEAALGQLTMPLVRGLVRRMPGVRFCVAPIRLLAYDGTVPEDLDLVVAREPWRLDGSTRIDVLLAEPVLAASRADSALTGATTMTAAEVLRRPAGLFDPGVWRPVTDYWALAGHGRPRTLTGPALTSPANAARAVRVAGACICAPLSILTYQPLRAIAGPLAAARVIDVAPNRAGLLSRPDDRSVLVREVRRQALALTRTLGPVLLPDGVTLTGSAGDTHDGPLAVPELAGLN